MPYVEPQSPPALNHLQTWFGSIIAQPLAEDGGIRKLTPRRKSIKDEAKLFVSKSPTLESHQRIEIYNQQYWWRLINTLNDFFPFLTRLFGYSNLSEKILIPYLLAHRPVHWSINTIGDHLPEWIQKHYKEKDKQLVHDASILDRAFHMVFFFGLRPSADENSLELPLFLQPHVSLYQFPYQLFGFRKEMMTQPPEYWVEHDFPKLEKGSYFFRLFRNQQSVVLWKEITEAEYLMLQQFAKGSTIDQACEWLEGQSEAIRAEAELSLEKWFKDWTVQGILTPHET